MVLELVIRRVLELKHELVKWNPPNVDVRFPPPAPAQPFPWDYVNLDDILVDLKLSPDTLDVAVPRREEQFCKNLKKYVSCIVVALSQSVDTQI